MTTCMSSIIEDNYDKDEDLTKVYQDLICLELKKLEERKYDFLSSETFLGENEIKVYVKHSRLFDELKRRELLISYGNGKYRTAHVDLMWRIINLRAYPHTPSRALEFTISYDREPLSPFNEHKINELCSIKPLSQHRREALDIVIKALKEVYPSLSHFQLVALKRILTLRGPKHIGIVAPTASGKTLIFMIPVLMKAVEREIEGYRGTTAILIYPRKSLARDQIEKLIELIYRVNKELSRRYGKRKYITIGLDYGDIPRYRPDKDEPLLNIKCPVPKCDGILYLSNAGEVYCHKNKYHKLYYVYGYKEDVWTRKPHIYVTNIWTLYQRLMNIKTIQVIREAIYVVFDEAHVYAGYLGGHLHYIIKLLKDLLKRNSPIFIYSSATIPYPSNFLSKLSGLSLIHI